jgi:hypothetical protein
MYDRNRMITETGLPNFPNDFPDSIEKNQDKKNIYVERNIDKIDNSQKENSCLIQVFVEMEFGGLPHSNGIIFKMQKKTKKVVKVISFFFLNSLSMMKRWK